MDVAVITALNEAPTIGQIVHELKAMGLSVIVIDDGSVDGTGYLARANGAIVLVHKHSQGIAASLLQAYHLALEMQPDRILQLDAGGSHDPGEAWRLLASLDGNDMVIGSRFVKGGQYLGGKWYRKLLSRIAALACSWRVGYWLNDWTSGYRAFRPGTLQRLVAHSYLARMHAFQIEALSWVIGMRIVEVPITYRAGRSSFNRKVAVEAFKVWRSL